MRWVHCKHMLRHLGASAGTPIRMQAAAILTRQLLQLKLLGLHVLHALRHCSLLNSLSQSLKLRQQLLLITRQFLKLDHPHSD